MNKIHVNVQEWEETLAERPIGVLLRSQYAKAISLRYNHVISLQQTGTVHAKKFFPPLANH